MYPVNSIANARIFNEKFTCTTNDVNNTQSLFELERITPQNWCETPFFPQIQNAGSYIHEKILVLFKELNECLYRPTQKLTAISIAYSFVRIMYLPRDNGVKAKWAGKDCGARQVAIFMLTPSMFATDGCLHVGTLPRKSQFSIMRYLPLPISCHVRALTTLCGLVIISRRASTCLRYEVKT